MLKRVAAAAALSLTPIAATAVPAQAAYSCTVSVPSKVTISSPYRGITARFSSGCLNYGDWGWWSVVHPTQGPTEFLSYEGASSDTMDWYDWNSMGTYTVRPEGAWDLRYNEMTQNSPKMTVKLGARQSAGSSRSGNYVTVKGTSTRYSPSAGTYRPWAGTKVALRTKSCSSCSWKLVKTGTSDRYGRVSLKTYASTARYWRLTTADTGNTWGRASATIRR